MQFDTLRDEYGNLVFVSQLFALFSHWPVCVFVCLAEPLSSVSSLEVHFDLLDLTELTDMSDQELAEVFVDSDEENHNEPRAGESQYFLLLLLLDLDFNFASFAWAKTSCISPTRLCTRTSFKTKSVAGSAFCTLNLMLLGSFFPN